MKIDEERRLQGPTVSPESPVSKNESRGPGRPCVGAIQLDNKYSDGVHQESEPAHLHLKTVGNGEKAVPSRTSSPLKTRSFQEFVRVLVEHFNRESAVYAITGAVAASYYGIPRTTLDADFVVHISSRDTTRFFRGMERAGVKVDLEKIRRNIKSGYNVVTLADRFSPYSADFILVENPPERKKGTLVGVKTYFQSPESLILAKLRMIKATIPRERSQKDREDVRAIIANTRVNKRKIIDRARKEGTIEIFREIIRPAQTQRKGKRTVRLDDNSGKRLKTGDKELKRLQYNVAASREDIDRILSS